MGRLKVEIRLAEESDRLVLSNLLQLYLHDFSEFDGSSVGADGLFEYPHLSHYWEDADRHAFIITVNGKVAGFALLKRGSELAQDMQAMDVAEFFVLRGLRRRGVGREALRALVQRYPGSWLVRVQDRNPEALAFWERVIPEVVDSATLKGAVYDGEREWSIFRFASPGAGRRTARAGSR